MSGVPEIITSFSRILSKDCRVFVDRVRLGNKEIRDKTKLRSIRCVFPRSVGCDKNKLCVAVGLILIAVVGGIIRLMC